MQRTYIADVKDGQQVKIQGFVENLRDGKAMAFLVIKDITGVMQVTVEKEKAPAVAEVVSQLTLDSVVTIIGQAVANEYVKLGGIEVLPEEMIIESLADALPINRKEIPATKKKKAVERSSIDQRIDYRWVDLRTEENQMLFKVQTCLVGAMREFLLKKNFNEIHTPKLIGAASDGPVFHNPLPCNDSQASWLLLMGLTL